MSLMTSLRNKDYLRRPTNTNENLLLRYLDIIGYLQPGEERTAENNIQKNFTWFQKKMKQTDK